MNLGVIGTGNMAEALIAGVIAKKVFKPSQILGFDVDSSRLAKIKKKYKIQKAPSALSIVKDADMILLAVKPQQMRELLESLKSSIRKDHIVISIAAGITTKNIKKWLGVPSLSVIRVMPNTPAFVGCGASVFFGSCSTSVKKIIQKIFGAVGFVAEVKNESLINGVTAVSGSGPAYVYLFLQSLIEGGVKCGLDRKLATSLALQTVVGGAAWLKASQMSPEDLIKQVASKGGTTEAGLKVLFEQKWNEILIECVVAAQKRAEELSGE